MKNINSFLRMAFLPHYDELSLFSMSYIIILLLHFNSGLSVFNISSDWSGDPRILLLFLIFFIGIFLSIYHAFSKRKKTGFEKRLMAYFAGFLNGFCGIWYGTYVLVHDSGWTFGIFPIWNIFESFLTIGSIRTLINDSQYNEEVVSDKNVSFGTLITGTVFVSILFIICQFYLQLIWAATFSICMVWISTFNRGLNSFLLKNEIINS